MTRDARGAGAEDRALMGAQLRILIVEDSEDEAECVVEILQHEGFDAQFERVDSAEKMTGVLDRDSWDVIISDYVMPHFSGLEALRLAQAKDPDVPFIIVSGRIPDETAVEAMRAGACDYITKDHLSRLAPAIARELREAQRRRERRQAQEALRRSEERYRTLVENISDVIYSVTARGKIRYVSPAVERMTHYRPDELVGQHYERFVHPDDLAQIRESFRGALSGETGANDFRLVDRDGTVRNVRTCSRPVLERGKVVGVTGVLSDVTQRLRAEEALRESQERYQRAVEAGRVGVWEWNLDTNEMYLAPNLKGMLGYADGDIANQVGAWAEHLHPDDRLWVMNAAEACVEGRSPQYEVEHRMLHKDGSVRWFATRGTVIRGRDGRPARMVGTDTDITERKQGEEERRKLGSAVEQTGESVMITDTEGTIEYVNAAFETLTGYSRDEVTGRNAGDFEASSFHGRLLATIRQGVSWSGRVTSRKKDGTPHEVEATVSPILDADGRIVNFVSVKRDVTREAHLERQLRQAQKMEAVGQLAGGVAHDFNNLLQGIQGYAQLACEGLERDDLMRSQLEEIVRAAERGGALTQQLLTFSRQRPRERKCVNLNRVISDMTKMLRRLIGEDIELVVTPGAGVRPVFGDPGQLSQVVVNLCVNARDAMPEGGRIAIRTANEPRRPEGGGPEDECTDDGLVLLAVEDTGVGMTPEVRERVFEPFFTTKEVGKGTGLGLATVYGIVKHHGGRIDIRSKPGSGTVFEVYLPAAERETDELEEHTLERAPGGTETILVAEDEEIVRRATMHVLERGGYHVLLACDGDEAIRLFDEHADEISLALLDVVMPKASGRAVCQHIHTSTPELPVVFSTGHGTGALDDGFLRNPRIRSIQKPHSPAALLLTIRAALESSDQAVP